MSANAILREREERRVIAWGTRGGSRGRVQGAGRKRRHSPHRQRAFSQTTSILQCHVFYLVCTTLQAF